METDAKAALPPFHPFSLPSSGSVRLKVQFAHMQMKAQERDQTCQVQMELCVKVCRLEIEAEKTGKIATN